MTLRVAFVMPGVGAVERGAEVFVLDLCRALGQRPEFDVALFSRGGSSGDGFLGHRIAALERDRPWLLSMYNATRLGRKGLDTLFLDPLNLEWDSAALASLPRLWRERYDVVVMEGGLVGAWLCRLLRRLRGSAFIDIAHGNSPKWEGAFARQGPDRVVAFTQAGAEMIQGEAPSARIEVIPHGVDLERFRDDTEPVDLLLHRPIFLTAGSVDQDKQMALSIEALRLLGRGSLVVLGDGPEARRLDALGEALLGPRRYLRTRVPRHAMAPWYRAADCFTLPSRSEAFGLVYLEAMACGLPCVAPDDAVRREVVGEAGLFCEVGDVQAYGEALLQAIERPWNGQPRRRAESFSFVDTAAAYGRLLKEVSACRPGS